MGLSNVGRARVGLRHLEDLMTTAGLEEGEVTGENAAEEPISSIISDKVGVGG